MQQLLEPWTLADALDLYELGLWGQGYFGINRKGNVCVQPSKDPKVSIDLKELVDRMRLRGIEVPILFRFGDVIKSRLGEIHHAFEQAIAQHGYQGKYCCVYPIKVNQQREVVEEVIEFGRPYHYGLEAGSKPELLAVIALADNEMPIICNGFKDSQFIEMAVLARKMGRKIIPVVEKYSDLELILHYAEKIGVRPEIGMRVKLASRGSGKWSSSGGHRSKFGLTVGEILQGLEALKQRGMADCFQLLHFHLGSQITNIQRIKAALTEAARIYTELSRLGAGLKYLDVGGGLAVDYDGSQTDFHSSMNYTLQEYANDVVYYIQNVCDDEKVPHPTIVSESGRAIVAHHSVLVFNVLGVSGKTDEEAVPTVTPEMEQPLLDLRGAYDSLSTRNLLENYHDAQQALDMAMNLFAGGYMPLEQRSKAESLYWAICRKIGRLLQQLDYTPEELQGLDARLSETYFCNFSLFQSMPDTWGIGQLFPVMPIHRLTDRPSRPAVLGDITCDSMGKIDQFIDRRDVRRTIHLHPFNGSPYYVGVFLVGAYQEILGDLHNLFGDTNAVHVRLDEQGEVMLDTVISGDTVREVLKYVNFDADTLVKQLRTDVERAVRQGRLSDEEAGRFMRFYEEGLRDYTYLSAEISPLITDGRPVSGNGVTQEARAVAVGG